MPWKLLALQLKYYFYYKHGTIVHEHFKVYIVYTALSVRSGPASFSVSYGLSLSKSSGVSLMNMMMTTMIINPTQANGVILMDPLGLCSTNGLI